MSRLEKLGDLLQDDEIDRTFWTGAKLLLAGIVAQLFMIPVNLVFYFVAFLAVSSGSTLVLGLTMFFIIPLYVIAMIVTTGLSVRWLYNWE